MAAVRSALMGLCRRRCGSSASSAAASILARGLGVRQVVGAAATRTPALPSLRPAAARNLECWRPFSTEGMEGACQNKPLLMKHKAESILRMLWQRSRDSVKNVSKDPTVVAASISFLTTFCFVKSTFCSSTATRTKNVHFHHPNAFASSINASAISANTRTEPGIITNVYSYLKSLLRAFVPRLGGIYLRSLRTEDGERKARSPLPRAFVLIPGIRGIYFSSLHTAHGRRRRRIGSEAGEDEE